MISKFYVTAAFFIVLSALAAVFIFSISATYQQLFSDSAPQANCYLNQVHLHDSEFNLFRCWLQQLRLKLNSIFSEFTRAKFASISVLSLKSVESAPNQSPSSQQVASITLQEYIADLNFALEQQLQEISQVLQSSFKQGREGASETNEQLESKLSVVFISSPNSASLNPAGWTLKENAVFENFLTNFLCGRSQSQLEYLVSNYGINIGLPDWLIVSKESDKLFTSLQPRLWGKTNYFLELERINFLNIKQLPSYLLEAGSLTAAKNLFGESREQEIPDLQIFYSLMDLAEFRELADLLTELFRYDSSIARSPVEISFANARERESIADIKLQETEISIFPELPSLQLVIMATEDYAWKFWFKLLQELDPQLSCLVDSLTEVYSLSEQILRSASRKESISSEEDINSFAHELDSKGSGVALQLLVNSTEVTSLEIEKLTLQLQLLELLLLKLQALVTQIEPSLTRSSFLTWLLQHSSYTLWQFPESNSLCNLGLVN